MADLTGSDAIRASRIVSAYVAQFKANYTKNEIDKMVRIAIDLNNYGVGRSD